MNNTTLSPQQQDEDVIYILPLLNAIRKKLFLVLLIGAIFGAAAYVGTKLFITPLYRTSFTLYVNNKTESDEIKASVSSSDITASRSLASTYAEIITSRSVLIPAADKCGLSVLKYDRLSGYVTASTSTTSEIITVYVKGTSPTNALYFAQAVSYAAEEQIANIVEGSSMRIIDEPYEPEEIYSPHYTRNAAIGFILGAFLVCAIVVIKELLDDRVKDEDSLETRFGIAVLGTIPNFQDSTKQKKGYYGDYARADETASRQQRRQRVNSSEEAD